MISGLDALEFKDWMNGINDENDSEDEDTTGLSNPRGSTDQNNGDESKESNYSRQRAILAGGSVWSNASNEMEVKNGWPLKANNQWPSSKSLENIWGEPQPQWPKSPKEVINDCNARNDAVRFHRPIEESATRLPR